MAKAKVKASPIVEKMVAGPLPLRLDFGCGKNKRDGFVGVDQFPMTGVDIVTDLAGSKWPWAESSVDEAHASHFLEHLTNLEGRWERIRFFNELFRILKPGANAQIIIPHWASNRYYGDPTHKEGFSEMGFYYLNREWRLAQAPHTDIEWNKNGYSCDFNFTYSYTMHASILPRNQEYQQFALSNYKEAAQDIIATLTAKK